MKSYSSCSQARYAGSLDKVRARMVREAMDLLPDFLPHLKDSSRVSQRKGIRIHTAFEKKLCLLM